LTGHAVDIDVLDDRFRIFAKEMELKAQAIANRTLREVSEKRGDKDTIIEGNAAAYSVAIEKRMN
jgi:hypothetical protein